jgi:hypothetical protein
MFSWRQSHQGVFGRHNLYAEALVNRLEVAKIEGRDHVRSTIRRRLEHQFVSGIS